MQNLYLLNSTLVEIVLTSATKSSSKSPSSHSNFNFNFIHSTDKFLTVFLLKTQNIFFCEWEICYIYLKEGKTTMTFPEKPGEFCIDDGVDDDDDDALDFDDDDNHEL